MKVASKGLRKSDNYHREIELMIRDYIATTGDRDWNRLKVADWAIKNGRWEQQRGSAIKQLARDISRVAGKATFVDQDGNTVRKYHAWRLGHDQPTLWSSMEVITPEHMAYSINSRRDKLVDGAVKAIIDAEYFNRHHNSGDPILFQTDLTKDVTEKRQSSLYEDTPPGDEK